MYRTLDQKVDETVGRMSRALGLDAEQQAKLHVILLDEYRQAREQRQNSPAGADRVAATMTIVDATKARIRAILTKEQTEKYESDVPRDQTAPAQADLQHWMKVQESNRQSAGGESK